MKTRKKGGVVWSNSKKSCSDNKKDWNRVWKHISGYESYIPSYLYPGKYNLIGSKPIKDGLINKDGTRRVCPTLSEPVKPTLSEEEEEEEEEKEPYRDKIIRQVLYDVITFESIPNEFKNDPDFLLEIVAKKDKFFKYIPIELKQNINFMIKLILKKKSVMYDVSKELKENPKFMLEIIKQDGMFLHYGSQEIKDNDTIVTEAILQSGKALIFASERLSHDLPMIIIATEKSSNPLTELTYYQKQLLSMKKLPYVKNNLLSDSFFTGFLKDNSNFGVVNYKSGVNYYGEINFRGQRTGKGELTIKNATINAVWDQNKIERIENVTNNSSVILTIDEFEILIPFMKNTNLVYPMGFYRLCGFIQTESKVEDFLKKMKAYTGTLRLAVFCHGDLHDVPFDLPIDQLTRISIVPNGVCNTIYSPEYLKSIKTFFLPTFDFLEKIKQQFLNVLKDNCKYYDLYDNEEDEKGHAKKWFTKCNILTKIPEKIFRKQDKILDKTYDFNGPNFNILLLIDESGDYINLFSIKNSFKLTEILTYTPVCSNFIIADFSCSFNESLSEEQLNTWGGTKKRKKKYKYSRKQLFA